MTVLALVFGPSRTGYHAGADHFNFDIEQWLAQGYVDGGECVNLRREGQSCKGDGESVNNGGYCTGCFMAKKRKSDGAQSTRMKTNTLPTLLSRPRVRSK